jgi:glycosyltransferase involved in cell wall biosynthesis
VAPYLEEHYARCCEFHPVADILFVNDGSTDATGELLSKLGVKTISLEAHFGKSEALKAGFQFAIQHGYDAVITMDSDLQHAHKMVPHFVADFKKGSTLVLGKRNFQMAAMPFARILSNSLSSGLVRLLTNKQVSDSQCGFRLIAKDYLDISVNSRGFQFETEHLVHACWSGATVSEIAIPTIYNQSKSAMKYGQDTLKFSLLFFRLFKEKIFRTYAKKK